MRPATMQKQPFLVRRTASAAGTLQVELHLAFSDAADEGKRNARFIHSIDLVSAEARESATKKLEASQQYVFTTQVQEYGDLNTGTAEAGNCKQNGRMHAEGDAANCMGLPAPDEHVNRIGKRKREPSSS